MKKILLIILIIALLAAGGVLTFSCAGCRIIPGCNGRLLNLSLEETAYADDSYQYGVKQIRALVSEDDKTVTWRLSWAPTGLDIEGRVEYNEAMSDYIDYTVSEDTKVLTVGCKEIIPEKIQVQASVKLSDNEIYRAYCWIGWEQRSFNLTLKDTDGSTLLEVSESSEIERINVPYSAAGEVGGLTYDYSHTVGSWANRLIADDEGNPCLYIRVTEDYYNDVILNMVECGAIWPMLLQRGAEVEYTMLSPCYFYAFEGEGLPCDGFYGGKWRPWSFICGDYGQYPADCLEWDFGYLANDEENPVDLDAMFNTVDGLVQAFIQSGKPWATLTAGNIEIPMYLKNN